MLKGANWDKLGDMEKEFMNLREVADYLRLNVYSVYRMAEQGRIPAMKAGRLWRFRKEEIDKWMKDQAKGRRRK